MGDDMMPFSAAADPELGEALRDALAPHFPEAFAGRVMARLAQRQQRSWDEELATGTGFPRVFYLNYHLYKDYFPLLALSSFVKARAT